MVGTPAAAALSATALVNIVAPIMRDAGVPDEHCHPHMLRHTFATLYLRRRAHDSSALTKRRTAKRILSLNLGHFAEGGLAITGVSRSGRRVTINAQYDDKSTDHVYALPSGRKTA